MRRNVFQLVLVALLASACTQPPKTAGEHIDDSWIHTKVKSSLVGYGGGNINVEVYQGVVLLAGFVRSRDELEQAVRQARSVRGVVAVKNHLVVQATQRTPGQLLDDGVTAGKVKAALADNRQTRALEINVEVRRGVVLLSGFVENHGLRVVAEDVARDQPGVEDVINGLEVTSG